MPSIYQLGAHSSKDPPKLNHKQLLNDHQLHSLDHKISVNYLGSFGLEYFPFVYLVNLNFFVLSVRVFLFHFHHVQVGNMDSVEGTSLKSRLFLSVEVGVSCYFYVVVYVVPFVVLLDFLQVGR